jgi:hypothetical protein
LSLPNSKTTKGIFQDRIIGDLALTSNQIQISYQGADNNDIIHFIQVDIAINIKNVIQNNTLTTPTGQTLRTNGVVTGISHNGNVSGELLISQNNISINQGNYGSASNFYGVFSSSVSTATSYLISDNTIELRNDNPTTGNVVISGVYSNDGVSAVTNKEIVNNNITIETKNLAGVTHGIFQVKQILVQLTRI